MDRLSAEDTNEGNLDASLKSMLITTYEKQDLHGFFFLGSQYPKSRKLVEEVWKQETHQTWAKDLTFVCGSWLSRLRHQALQMKIFPQEVEQIKKLKIVSEKKLMDYLADLILLKDTSTGGFTPTMMEENKNMIFYRISGNEKMKAMNRYEQARECDSRGDYETAALHMKRAIELQPENATFHYLYGAYLGHLCKNARGLRQEELLIEAIQECEIAANLPEGTGVEPDKPHVEPGIILANIGRYEEAVRYLESIEKKTGKTPWFMLSLGGARYLLEDFAGAWDCLQMAIKFFTDDAIALERAGHCCFELGLKKEGAEFLKRANFLGQSRVYDFWQAGGFKTALIQTKR